MKKSTTIMQSLIKNKTFCNIVIYKDQVVDRFEKCTITEYDGSYIKFYYPTKTKYYIFPVKNIDHIMHV